MLRAFLAGLILLAAGAASALAGVLTHDELVQRFPSPYIVGQKDAALPVWPVFKQNATSNELVGYVFESIDLAPIPGFSGVPMNLLVALDHQGNFLDVQVLSHHEPVFLDGLGEAPLFKFVSQYRGLSLMRNISIDTGTQWQQDRRDSANVHIDGVTKATASVRILNQSILSAALKVARGKLGFSGKGDPDRVARIRSDVFESLDIDGMLKAGLLKHMLLKNAEVEQRFAGTPAGGIDPQALASPADTFIDLQVAWLSVPSIGRSLLGPSQWNKLKGRLEEGDHAFLVISHGTYSVVPDDFVPGAVSERLALTQGGLPLEMRDLNLDLSLPDGIAARGDTVKVFRVISQAGLDPALPLEFSLNVTRLKGMIYPERIRKDFKLAYQLPERFFIPAAPDSTSWVGIWKQRWWELAVIVVGIAVLFIALAKQRSLTANARRFTWFRRAYLLFTVFFIGWYAQGQLSIVNITSVVQALREGRSLGFLLFDPPTVILWGAVAISLFIWGRGTFCGWLCPFGALQEGIARAGAWLRIPTIRIRADMDARLKRIKYILFAGIVASALLAPAVTDKAVEIEPFKTAVTLVFQRSWPFVLYALVLLMANMMVYKMFCRYLCPLGAGLALFGRVRLWRWLPRRAECGAPCQTCRHRCQYQAIEQDGSIRYDDCFQCMECVVIYRSDEQCAPLIMEAKRRRTIPIQVADRKEA
ncbi:MAG TPA: 4Fe-4S binding protein [Noviherbaspirillum sp.]|nr:4Fe-4S binding protein [Noviherbaspirillum sp.]